MDQYSDLKTLRRVTRAIHILVYQMTPMALQDSQIAQAQKIVSLTRMTALEREWTKMGALEKDDMPIKTRFVMNRSVSRHIDITQKMINCNGKFIYNNVIGVIM